MWNRPGMDGAVREATGSEVGGRSWSAPEGGEHGQGDGERREAASSSSESEPKSESGSLIELRGVVDDGERRKVKE